VQFSPSQILTPPLTIGSSDATVGFVINAIVALTGTRSLSQNVFLMLT
jgi:hypothetical protein